MIKCECNCEDKKCGIDCTCVNLSKVKYLEGVFWKTTDKSYRNISEFDEFLKQNGISDVKEYYLVKG
jgi:hypothetical protein